MNIITTVVEFSIYLVVYYTIHTLLASSKLKDQLKLSSYRLIYNTIAILTIVPVVMVLNSSVNARDITLTFSSIAGILLFLAGVYIVWVSFSSFDLSEFLGLKQESTESLTLFTKGYYSFSRHPMYFGSILIFWSLYLLFSNNFFLSFAIISTTYAYAGSWSEEQKLIKTFGNPYIEYQNSVSMIIPFRAFFKKTP